MVAGLPPHWVADKAQWASAKKQLKPLFAKHGTVLSIRSAKLNPTKYIGASSKRRARAQRGPPNRCFVSFSTAEEAAAAMAALSGAELVGRVVTITMALDQGVRASAGGGARRAAADDAGPEDGSQLPSDFATRSSKVELDRERQKEEEHAAQFAGTCTICGKSGHFAQGCPLTLGAPAACRPAAVAPAAPAPAQPSQQAADAFAAAVATAAALTGAAPPAAAPPQAAADPFAALLSSLHVPVPAEHIGLVVGEGGATIARIRRESGVELRILDPYDTADAAVYRARGLDPSSGGQRLVELKGLTAQCEQAKAQVLACCPPR